MAQTPEAVAFLRHLSEITDTHGADLRSAIIPSLQDEADLRHLFATDRKNVRLKDPHVGLVDVFGQNTDHTRKIHARAVKDDEVLQRQYVMPLADVARRKHGEPSMAPSLTEFEARWSIFSEGVLSQMTDWRNVVAAGGGVLACLAPLPEHVRKEESKRAVRKYYHSEAYPASDVDLFLYGLTPKEAEDKCIEIYNAVQDSVPWEVCAVRTKHAVSIHCQFPYRTIQIILRLYQSPAEILAGFDVDSACVAYDGTHVLAAPRAIMALMTQSNQVAMDRRSPSYEVRLAKYAARGFEIHVPDLRRDDIDPTIFERAITRVTGLARLLVFEKLSTQEARDGYIDQRREIRGRPKVSRRQKRKDKSLTGDLKSAPEFGGFAVSDYDVMFHIPYGPGINAKKICKLVYQTDLGMNSTFNPKNKGQRLHRHPAFFGSMEEALEDCCECCPTPETEVEKELFQKEKEQFLTGRVSFIHEDPGRQTITGSFRPIDAGEWSEQAYLKPVDKLFSYITSHNRQACIDLLKRNADAVGARDHLGRTPLQLALLCSAEDICLDLIELGARISSRMVDGRSALHLAAQKGLPKVVKALLERNEKNKAENPAMTDESKEKDLLVMKQDDEVQDSSEDDWSSDGEEDEDSEDYEDAKKKVPPKDDPVKREEDALDAAERGPDIFVIDAPDWDQSLTALGYAIIRGCLGSVRLLVAAGADCTTPRNLSSSHGSPSTFYPLVLTALTSDESVGAQIAECLITNGGASCSAADADAVTIFHRLVSFNKPQIIEIILKIDPSAKAASRFLYGKSSHSAIHPITTAFASGQRGMAALLLAYAGTRPFVDLETFDRSVAANPDQGSGRYPRAGKESWLKGTLQPLEASLADYNDLYRLVLELEPESVKTSVPRGVFHYQHVARLRRSMVEFFGSSMRSLKRRSRMQPIQSFESSNIDPRSAWRSALDLSERKLAGLHGWDTHVIALEKRYKEYRDAYVKAGYLRDKATSDKKREEEKVESAWLIPYFREAFMQLEEAGALTWDHLYDDLPSSWKAEYGERDYDPDDVDNSLVDAGSPNGASRLGEPRRLIGLRGKPFKRYSLFTAGRYEEVYPGTHLIPLYDKLYEACWSGDNDKIRALCLPSSNPLSVNRDLLQVTAIVKFVDHTQSLTPGYSPLFAALRARKWDTARLILRIAQEQLTKDKDNQQRDAAHFTATADDEDDNDSCASDETTKQPLGFADLAERFHTVSVNIKPAALLSYRSKSAVGPRAGLKQYFGEQSPIELAAEEGDVEAFVQIADMMVDLPEPMQIPNVVRRTILFMDSPDMLDAYIRSTGDGLCVPELSEHEGLDGRPSAQGDEDDTGIYLGLNIHGKKRRDLARREDPNPSYEETIGSQVSLVWHAASKQATSILEYLHNPRAMEAYKHYAERNKTKLAKQISSALRDASVSDFRKMIGFDVGRLGETPVLAAVWSMQTPERAVETLKKLMELDSRLTVDGIRRHVKPNRTTPLLFLCAAWKVPVDAIDWLLANGADPLACDERGWNLLHVLFFRRMDGCSLVDIEHVLQKLPTDTLKTLVSQQSKTQRNTPLAIAIKKGDHKLVELILNIVKNVAVPSLLLRDSTGATPLHSAILSGHTKIVALLIASGPPEMLYMENGVGSTPMEIARLQYLTQSIRGLVGPLEQANDGFDAYEFGKVKLGLTPGIRERDRKEVQSLKRVMEGIKSSGVLANKPELLRVLEEFEVRSEREFDAWVTSKKASEGEPGGGAGAGEGKDARDVVATFKELAKAVVEVHQRRVVHLRDVQHAVFAAVELQAKGKALLETPRADTFDDEAEPGEKTNVDCAYSAIVGLPKVDTLEIE